MQRFLTWIGKEWAQHRRALGILAGLIPVTVGGLFCLDRRWLNDEIVLKVLLPGVLVTFTLCVGADLFASERTRTTFPVIQRLPAATAPSWAAKMTILLGSALGLLLWTGSCVSAGWWLAGEPEKARQCLSLLFRGEACVLALPGLAFVVWVALVSTWFGSSGLAATAATVLLGVVLLPAAVITQRHPYFLDWRWAWLPVSVLVLVLSSAGAWLSYTCGWRHGRIQARALAWGLAWVVLSGGSAYGLTFWTLHRYLDLDEQDPELEISQAWLGTGERFVFLNVRRGDDWSPGYNSGWDTPPRPFRLDLARHSFEPMADFLEYVEPIGHSYSGRPWHSTVARLRILTEDGLRVFDASSGEEQDPRDHPDATGRERGPWAQVPGGWLRFAPQPDSAYLNLVVTDLDGEITWRRRNTESIVVLHPHRILSREHSGSSRGYVRGSWVLHDLETGRSGPTHNPPGKQAVVTVYRRDRVLVIEEGALFTWNPVSGRRVPIDWHGPAPEGIERLARYGPLDGRHISLVLHHTAGSSSEKVAAQARLSTDDDTATLVHSWDHRPALDYVGTGEDGALWIVEDERRVLRLGPAPGDCEIVFPRL